MITIAFDVYGTLIDTHGVTASLEKHVGSRARAFSTHWRDKQLEYSFRRGLMRNYQDFSVCTRQALEHACRLFRVDLGPEDRDALMAVYRTLPAFPDVPEALASVTAAGYRIHAFSNGSREAVETLLEHAGIRDRFHGVVSVEDIRSFKPDPAVYAHFLRTSGAAAFEAWMVSGNPFDVIGAASAGMRTAWVRRSDESVYDPWDIEPMVTIESLRDLADAIALSNASPGLGRRGH